MHGNINEMCLEELVSYLNPVEPGTGHRQGRGGSPVVRGGCFFSTPEMARLTYRSEKTNRGPRSGFRPARRIDPEKKIGQPPPRNPMVGDTE